MKTNYAYTIDDYFLEESIRENKARSEQKKEEWTLAIILIVVLPVILANIAEYFLR